MAKLSDLYDTATTKIAGKLGGASAPSGGSGATKTPPAVSLNLAGSLAYNQSNLTTSADLTGAKVDHYTSGTAVATNLTAISDPVPVSGAGAGARLSGSANTSASASVAGAVTLDDSTNRAQARIEGGSISDAGATAVHALNGGIRASAALGLATTSGSSGSSGEGAGSASILIKNDSAGAYVDNTAITGAPGATGRNLDVTAYNAAEMGAGGGSGFSGGEGGVGLSFTFLGTLDPSGEGATEAEITNSTLNHLDAVSDLADDSSVLVGLALDASTGSATLGVNLSGVDVDTSRTTTALVSGGRITAASLSVQSAGLRQSALDGQLLAGAPSAATLSGYDFSTGGLGSSVSADPSGDHSIDFATGKGALIILAAGAGGAGENTAGAAVVATQFGDSHSATLKDATAQLTGAVSVQASDDALIVGAAVGAGAAEGTFAGTGSVAVLQSGEAVSATLGDATSTNATRVSADSVDVRAADTGTLAGLAGAVSVSEGCAAIGASVTVLTSANTVSAVSQNAIVDPLAGAFTTEAEQQGLYADLAITGAVSEGVSVGGAASVNAIDNGAQALATNINLADGRSAVDVYAADSSDIFSGASGIAVGETAAVGLAATVNDISAPSGWDSRVKAELSGGDLQADDVALVVSIRNDANNWLLQKDVTCLIAEASASALADQLFKGLAEWNELQPVRQSAARLVARVAGRGWSAELAEIINYIVRPAITPTAETVRAESFGTLSAQG